MRNSIMLAAALLLALSRPCAAGDWGPWSSNSDAPVLLTPADREAFPAEPQIHSHPVAATPFLWILAIYQNYITHIDGDRCPMYPTCSQYSVQALRKHGPILGVIMTADRLLHEADEAKYAFMVRVGNRYRYSDPVEENDFWWHKQ